MNRFFKFFYVWEDDTCHLKVREHNSQADTDWGDGTKGFEIIRHSASHWAEKLTCHRHTDNRGSAYRRLGAKAIKHYPHLRDDILAWLRDNT